MLAAIDHARTIRERLRNPPNAVKDCGIDLKRKVIPIAAIRDSVVVPVNVFGPIVATVDDIAFGPIVADASLPYAPIGEIIRIVARYYSVSRMDMLSARRTAPIVLPRQIAMYLARILTLKSLPEIGRRFGGRDHTTVIHAARKIEALRRIDSVLESDLQKLSVEIGISLRPPVQPTEAQHATPQPAAH